MWLGWDANLCGLPTQATHIFDFLLLLCSLPYTKDLQPYNHSEVLPIYCNYCIKLMLKQWSTVVLFIVKFRQIWLPKESHDMKPSSLISKLHCASGRTITSIKCKKACCYIYESSVFRIIISNATTIYHIRHNHIN